MSLLRPASATGERVSGSAIVLTLTGLLVSLSTVVAARQGIHMPWTLTAFGAFVCLGEIMRVTLPGGRDVAPISTSGGLGLALLANFAGQPARFGAAAVIMVVAFAMVVGALPHVAAGRAPALDAMARRLLSIAAAAALFRMTPLLALSEQLRRWQLAIVLVLIAVVALVIDAVLAAVLRAGRDFAPFWAVLRDELVAIGMIGTAVGATGVLIALASVFLGYWALPIFLVPLLLTQFAFRRFASIRATYLQTIRSLARVTEVGGYTETGHARRVSELAVAVGKDLGLSEAALLELEYAALMHDIGQLSLAEPIPGGATVMATLDDQRRIAGYGGAVIRQTGVLDGVATIVERQADPYRRPIGDTGPQVPLAARIIRAVNGYDDLVGESTEASRRIEAIERLRLGMAYEYDPRVVDSLARVIERVNRLSL